ncbi:MAG: PIN domain-containing protein [Acidobacteria bacterium]|nr:PIN domain-containing protein [Acidobacteriota bacterium]MBI3261573.1 PIN domain-containing protein [Acidobacteriota bacterium]
MLALLDRNDRHHDALREICEQDPSVWILPWAILPEVDYLAATQLGHRAAAAFLDDVADASFRVEWGRDEDVERARHICHRYASLHLGLVDAVVIAVAERLHARAIATLDLRHFGAVKIDGAPQLLPRDLRQRT